MLLCCIKICSDAAVRDAVCQRVQCNLALELSAWVAVWRRACVAVGRGVRAARGGRGVLSVVQHCDPIVDMECTPRTKRLSRRHEWVIGKKELTSAVVLR